jgi:hypothetical protein
LNTTTTQTFAGTGDNVFSNIVTCTSGLNSNSNITLFSAALSSNIRQNTLGLEITNVDTSKYIQLITRTSGGGNTIGVSCANGNSAYIQGDSGAQISITNQQANIGGTNVPTVTTQPLTASNNNEIATTAWTKTQLTGYASLNGNNTMNGTNNFTKSVQFRDVAPTAPVVITNTVSSNTGGMLISASGSYNAINTPGDFSVIGFGTGINTGGVLTLTTHSSTNCGIRIENSTIKYNAPFTCNYNTLATRPTKTNNDIGYVWSVQGSSFNSWNGFTSYGNVYTLVWDGSGDKTYGVWRCDICIATQTSSAMDSGFVLSTTNNFVINTRSAWSNALTSFGVNPAQIVRLSCILDITNLTDTYYLNFKINGGSSRSDLTGASQILFTRIA